MSRARNVSSTRVFSPLNCINGLNQARPHRLLTAATATKHDDDDDDDEDDWDDEDGDGDDNADDDDDDDDEEGRAEGDHGHCITQPQNRKNRRPATQRHLPLTRQHPPAPSPKRQEQQQRIHPRSPASARFLVSMFLITGVTSPCSALCSWPPVRGNVQFRAWRAESSRARSSGLRVHVSELRTILPDSAAE